MATVAAIPAIFYLDGLGLYLDDYLFLSVMNTSEDRSLLGLFEAHVEADSKAWLRPVNYVGFSGLYLLFGTSPLPNHVFVAALVPACAVLLYLVLDRLRAPGFLALGAPIVFAAAPHYSTDRFWLASYSAPASVALALAALYAFLCARESHGRKLAAWLVAGGAALVLGVLLYEVPVPLLVVGVSALWYGARRGAGSPRVVAVTSSLLLVAVLVYKAIAATTLVGESSYRVGYENGFLHHIAYLVSGSVKVNFGTYGLGLPYVAGWIFAHGPSWTAVAASLLVGIVVGAYLTRSGRELELPARVGRPGTWLLLVASGVVLIGLGYATFLVTGKIYFTSAGIDNRVNIVAAMGVAVLAVGLVLRAVQFLPTRRQALGFAVACALLASTGTLITSTIADYWVEANERQQEVLARLSSALPERLTNTTVIVDGICQEVGPAVVFAAPYDLTGALRLRYGDPTVRAQLATPVVEAAERGLVISTPIFGGLTPDFHPYRPRLLVYDWRRGTINLLRDAASARRYLATTPRPSCPPLRTFAWGVRTSRFVPLA